MGLRVTPTNEQLKKKKKVISYEPYSNVRIEREIRARWRKNPGKLSEKELLILILSELRDIRSALEGA